MASTVWVLRSFLMVHIASALSILPQNNKVNENSQEIDDSSKVGSLAEYKRRFSYDEKLSRKFSRDSKPLKHFKLKSEHTARRVVAAEPILTPQKMLQAQRDEMELLKLSADVSKSALLGRPYIEKKGRNDFLVLQNDNRDPFVTVIPNNIYYNIEKKCVNWLDACSLRGLRAHLLERVLSPYK